MGKTKKKAPYYLLIHTNSYTGNFDRELIAYCIGKLDKEQKDYCPEFIKPFWNSYAGGGVDSLEDYKNDEDKETADGLCDLLKCLEDINSILDNESKETFAEKQERLKKERYEKDICRLYDEYLCETYQVVDDWEQDIFYNIESFYKNKEYNCDTVFIQLNKPLPEHLEKVVIERIKQFFENDVYNIIKNYQWICSFGHGYVGKEDYKLLDLELVDKDYNLVKKYV